MEKDMQIEKIENVEKIDYRLENGKPLIFPTPQELKEKCDEYFYYCDNSFRKVGDRIIAKPYTMTGLHLYLGISKDTFRDYAKREGYVSICKEAREKVENYVVERAMAGEINTTMAIFTLKNHFGWKDKQEVDINADININVGNNILAPED